MEQLLISQTKSDGYITLKIKGSLNSYTYSGFQDKLYSVIEQSSVCLDMTDVTNLSSAGLGVLMSAMESGKANGNKLYILHPSEIVKMAIESTGFGDLFQIINSVEEIGQ